MTGKPADGADERLGLAGVGPALGTVRVVKRVVVTLAVEVESTSSPEPWLPVGLGGLTDAEGFAGTGGLAEPEGIAETGGWPDTGVEDGPATPVMGQIVVLTAMISVVTWPILPGQSVTVAAQLVMV